MVNRLKVRPKNERGQPVCRTFTQILSRAKVRHNFHALTHFITTVVNGANVRRFLSRNVGSWRETEESTSEKLEKPLQSWIVSHRSWTCGRKPESPSSAKAITSACNKW